ncbi:MAG: SufE family protein [Dysgonamonadaceae bacterium]|jgi:cysteine desulfuration protein SufE|nr:SufE family protein [Dysgonamonadaceae bacterium]
MNTINDEQDLIISEFGVFDDWTDRYAALIEAGSALPVFDAAYRTQNNLIEGCQSRVWLQADFEGGLIRFRGESDSVIVKGIMALLIRVLSHRSPEEILSADLYFIESIGLRDHLSPTRSNGLLSMLRQMRLYAMAFASLK